MDGWQIDLIKGVGLAAISFAGGFGTYWLKNRAKAKDAERAEQTRQVEYNEFKKKRRLVGSGEVERMERAEKLTNIIIKQRAHEITPQEFHEYRERLNLGRKRSKKSEKTVMAEAAATQAANVDLKAVQDFIFNSMSRDMPEASRKRTAIRVLSIIDARGPNDKPVGYDEAGNTVEWLPHEEDEDADSPYWSIPLLRNEDDIYAAQDEFFEKIWWNRHQSWLDEIEAGETPEEGLLATAKAAAKKVEEKYGLDNLGWTDFEWGMINGKLSALRWVTGNEWDFLDT